MPLGDLTHALIFTSLPVETRAVLSQLRVQHDEWVSRQGTIGHVCTVDGKHGAVRVVVIQVQPSAEVAALVLQEAVEQLRPIYALLVGLATGVRDVSLGTVVAANKVYAYDRGADGRSFMTYPDLGLASHRLVCRAEAEALQSRWMNRIYAGNIPEAHPDVRVGAIAAGSPIVDSAEGAVWRFLQANYTDALAIETAGRGFLQAAHHAKLDAMVIRGMSRLLSESDGSNGGRRMEEEAARNAAAFTVEMLTRLPLGEEGDAAVERPQEPSYETPDQRRWALELKEKQAEKRRRSIAKEDVSEIDESILDLRRKLRDGPEPMPGYTLAEGRFILIRVLGQGGFGTVWEAWDDTEGIHVAVKILHGRLGRDPTMRDRFFRGSRTMDRLRHDAIVAIALRKGSDDGYHYFVMDLHRGRLREAVALGGLSRQSRANILIGLSDALAFAHESGVIHRDVKPDNVLLDVDLKPKLTDFDLVRIEGTLALTESLGMGSLGYSAPELLRSGRTASPQSDIYSLAATALYVLTGVDPDLEDVVRDPFGLVSRCACPRALKPVLARALAWHPRDRYPTMGHFRAALKRAFEAAESDPLSADEDPSATAAKEARAQIFSWTDAEVDKVVALAPPELRRIIHPKSRPVQRRADLAYAEDVIRDDDTAAFLDALDGQVRGRTSTAPAQKAGDAFPSRGEEDWEVLFESLACMPENDFESTLEQASIMAGARLARMLSTSCQWDAAAGLVNLMSEHWDIVRIAVVAKIRACSTNRLQGEPIRMNMFAREALLHAKMSMAFSQIERASVPLATAVADMPDLEEFRRMILERRDFDLDKTVDAFAARIFASGSSTFLTALGRIHTLASEASAHPVRVPAVGVKSAWRADRMRIYHALNKLSEDDFQRLVTLLCHPGSLPPRRTPRAGRSMAVVRFAERWQGTRALLEALKLGVDAIASPPISGAATGIVAADAEALVLTLLRMPTILIDEVFFGFGVDDEKYSRADEVNALVQRAGIDAVQRQMAFLKGRFRDAAWTAAVEGEAPYEDTIEAIVRLARAGVEVIEWVTGRLEIPREYLSLGFAPPTDDAVQLLDWAHWRVKGTEDLRHWVDVATAPAVIPPHQS
jgi:serine/threonine protein kinase/nucleoside phosphorylase